MFAELGRYLWWWPYEHRHSRLIFVVPLLVLGGTAAIVNNVVNGRLEAAFVSVGLVMIGFAILFLNFFTMVHTRPWNVPFWFETQNAQRAMCAQHGQIPRLPTGESMCGVSIGVGTVQAPLNGLRHPEADGSNGWYLWSGESLEKDPAFFEPVHYKHMAEREPAVLPYMALPPGWRFLIADGHEDVWFDETLLSPSD